MLQLWKDDGGAILAIEFILFVAILLFGLIVGYVGLRNAVVAEMSAVADAVVDLSVCFSYSGLSNCESSVCGFQAIPLPTPGIPAMKTAASNVSVISSNPCQ
jgi:hypothetical protein